MEGRVHRLLVSVAEVDIALAMIVDGSCAYAQLFRCEGRRSRLANHFEDLLGYRR
jgi:hypothetical protein